MTRLPSFCRFITEDKSTTYIALMRGNPPTYAHGMAMDQLKEMARDQRYLIMLSRDGDDNALPYKTRLKEMRKAFPRHARNIMETPQGVSSLVEVAKWVNERTNDNLVVLTNNNDVDVTRQALQSCLAEGTMQFNAVAVESAAVDYDDDIQLVNARNNDFTAFSQNAPTSMTTEDTKAMFVAVRDSLGLTHHSFANHVQLKPVSETREQYVRGELFDVGDRVILSKLQIEGTITHLGANFVTVDDDRGNSHRAWLEDVEEATAVDNKRPQTPVDKMRDRIENEKSKDNARYDRMMDLARLRAARKRNARTRPKKAAVYRSPSVK